MSVIPISRVLDVGNDASRQRLFSVLPSQLTQRRHWLLWRYSTRRVGDKPRKVPYYPSGSVRNGVLDSVEDVEQLGDFETVNQILLRDGANVSGLGFALVSGDRITGIDLDDCLDESGGFTNHGAREIVERAIAQGCYIEKSPSGRGIHVFGESSSIAAVKVPGFEVYCEKRYFTVTGDVYANPRGWGDITPAIEVLKRVIGETSKTERPPLMDAALSGDLTGGIYTPPERVNEGSRNSALLAYVGHLRASGVREALISGVAQDFNKARCVPPLDGGEVESIVGRYRENSPSNEVCDWAEPKEIRAALPEVPPFELNMLPGVIRPYVEDTADLMQAPADYIAVPLVVALAATLGNRWAIAPKARDKSWKVTPVLWGGIVGRPSTKKSPSIDKALDPLSILEADMEQAFQLQLQKYSADKIAYEVSVDQARRAAKSGGQMVLPPEPQKPHPERLVVNDSTVQKLAEILQWSPRGVLVTVDELVGLLESLRAEGQEAARAFYLAAWNGNQTHRVDRIGRGSSVVKRLAIWIVGGIQPGKLETYVRGAMLGGNSDDGLIQRFQLLVWPDAPSEWRNVDRPVNREAYEAVERAFKRLRNLDPIAVGARVDLDGGPAYLHFTSEAQELFDTYRLRLETQLRTGDRHPALESHFGKYGSLVAALALISHLVDGGLGPVEKAAVRKAIQWSLFLMKHAHRIYSCVTNASAASAKALSDKIRAGKLADGFSAREVQRHGWSGLTGHSEVRAALEWLTDASWIAPVEKRTGGRMTTVYFLNPRLAVGM